MANTFCLHLRVIKKDTRLVLKKLKKIFGFVYEEYYWSWKLCSTLLGEFDPEIYSKKPPIPVEYTQ